MSVGVPGSTTYAGNAPSRDPRNTGSTMASTMVFNQMLTVWFNHMPFPPDAELMGLGFTITNVLNLSLGSAMRDFKAACDRGPYTERTWYPLAMFPVNFVASLLG